jgi:hypothetical protein
MPQLVLLQRVLQVYRKLVSSSALRARWPGGLDYGMVLTSFLDVELQQLSLARAVACPW